MGSDVLVVPDASLDPRFESNPLVVGVPNIRFYAGAPLTTSDGLALGTMCVISNEARPPLSVQEIQTLKDLSDMAMAHIEARQAIGYIQPVTGLSNRFRFLEDVGAFIREHGHGAPDIAVIVIDTASPQQFAEVIRTLGHTFGDAFEVASSRRICENLPDRVKLYHLSTARFGCVLPLIAETNPHEVLNGLAAAFSQPIRCLEIPIATSFGIGFAAFPSDGEDAAELLRAATSAAHDALDSGKGLRSYCPARDQASRRSFRVLRDLPAALATAGQLHLVYQPKIDLRLGRCIGAEALLRWNHPELGAISPADFVPLAEQTALMRPLTDWVFTAALADVARWRRQGKQITISINASMKDLSDEKFAGRIAKILDQQGVQPDWIEVELTETALMIDQFQINRQLDELRRLGIDVAIDDFGTGQSAMSYLKLIEADIVKIDQMFIRELGEGKKDDNIVRSMINLSHELGYRVVAEGIETKEIYNWLRENGCDIGQGYLISRPLGASEFESWLGRTTQ
jgi:EAL domain-containing protein (putative c-di-GMP-specific phosphodiesterase class I)/GGDEF domain-containing protein